MSAKDELLLNRLCHSFLWFDGNGSAKNVLSSLKTKRHISVETMETIFVSTAANFPPLLLLSGGRSDGVEQILYEKFFSQVSFHKYYRSLQESHGVFVLKQDCRNDLSKMFNNIFQCISGEYISSVDVCDGTQHCGSDDTSDENDCCCTKETISVSRCKYICDSSNFCRCSPLYYLTHDRKCQGYIQDSNGYIDTSLGKITPRKTTNMIDKMYTEIKTFVNDNNNALSLCDVDETFMNDLVSDCGDSAEDEGILKDVLVSHKLHECPEPHQIPCRKGHNLCFNLSDICIFRLNSFNNLIPCRTGEHMEDYTNFQCNMKYKCPGYYCIVLAYLCDRKCDCPDGSDENNQHRCGQNRKCQNMFRCSSSQICIHPEDVCDRIVDCPLHDDEFVCNLEDVVCPKNCMCHIHAVLCVSVTPELDQKHSVPFIFVSVSVAKLELLDFLGQFPESTFIHLKFNSIDDICEKLSRNSKAIHLDIGYNHISALADSCFQQTVKLKIIDLEYNRINQIHSRAFQNLSQLIQLDLSNNNLQSFPKLKIGNLKISHFSISHNPLQHLLEDIFLLAEFSDNIVFRRVGLFTLFIYFFSFFFFLICLFVCLFSLRLLNQTSQTNALCTIDP